MHIAYASGPNINAPNIEPSNNPFGTKTFTVTGRTSLDDMKYHIVLVVEENTFTDDAIQYKLISENTDENGTVQPSSDKLTGIKTGELEIAIGNGSFESPTNGYKVHTYNLELYFPDTGEPQNENQGKTINAYVQIREGNVNILTLATDSDFEWVTNSNGYEVTNEVENGYYKYVGDSKAVIIPDEINGNLMTNYYYMFRESDVEKVVSTNPNVTSMNNMFYGSQATSLDLSSFDTPNLTNMSYMFYGSQAINLNLSSFDTSNVTNMNHMFYNCVADPRYARTQADADKFNSTSDYSGVQFTLKP